MSKTYNLEPIVMEALIKKPETRGDNFILYLEVLKDFIDTTLPIGHVFLNHKELGMPSLESITRCRRKLQERDPFLRPNDAKIVEGRKKEEAEMRDYALADKQWN